MVSTLRVLRTNPLDKNDPAFLIVDHFSLGECRPVASQQSKCARVLWDTACPRTLIWREAIHMQGMSLTNLANQFNQIKSGKAARCQPQIDGRCVL